jgi:hypothetical protein
MLLGRADRAHEVIEGHPRDELLDEVGVGAVVDALVSADDDGVLKSLGDLSFA